MKNSETLHQPVPEKSGGDEQKSIQVSYGLMQRIYRSFAFTLLLISIGGLFVEDSYTPYYLVLIFLSLMNLFLCSSFMWIVISIYIMTEWLTQLLLGPELLFFVGEGIIFVICLILYARYNKLERQYLSLRKTDKSNVGDTSSIIGNKFSAFAFLFGWLTPFIAIGFMILTFMLGIDSFTTGSIFNVLGNTFFELITLGLSFGVAAILAGTRYRPLAIGGMIPGIAAWLFEIFSILFLE